MHFILDVIKIYAVGFVAISFVIIAATAMQLLCTDQDTSEHWQKAISLIISLQLILAPFAIIFSVITVAVDRNKLKDDEDYAKYGFMYRIFNYDDDENGLD